MIIVDDEEPDFYVAHNRTYCLIYCADLHCIGLIVTIIIFTQFVGILIRRSGVGLLFIMTASHNALQ